MHLARPPQCLGAAFRQPRVANLPGRDELRQRADRLLDGHRAVDPMQIEQIDVIRTEPAQAGLARSDDRFRLVVYNESATAPFDSELGREEHVLAPAANG